MKQKELLAAQEQRLEELTLKIEDVETLVEEVSDIAYDKAVEVVTDTVRQETTRRISDWWRKRKTGYSRRNGKRRKKSVSMPPPGWME